jgi:hypothetical protein
MFYNKTSYPNGRQKPEKEDEVVPVKGKILPDFMVIKGRF